MATWRTMKAYLLVAMAVFILGLGGWFALADEESVDRPEVVVRCAVIGGMTDTGFWDGVVDRFEKETGIHAELVATGPKHVVAPVFRRGEADLITMHASDTIINLVADGFGVDPQPWARNDLLLVGPKDDPAGVKGMTDGVLALQKIIESKSKILVHASLGANEVLHDLLTEGSLELDLENTLSLPTDRHREMLHRAAKEKAYTLVGRIPFMNGKIASGGLEIMVAGDPRMRRPYLVVAADGDKPSQVAARRLAQFLRDPNSQRGVAEFGKGTLDDRPLFFPIELPRGKS
ncbi:MAG: substrate-binding domain-containing protein [Planctomycetota bacterium]